MFVSRLWDADKGTGFCSPSSGWSTIWADRIGIWGDLIDPMQRVRHDWATELNWTDWIDPTGKVGKLDLWTEDQPRSNLMTSWKDPFERPKPWSSVYHSLALWFWEVPSPFWVTSIKSYPSCGKARHRLRKFRRALLFGCFCSSCRMISVVFWKS